jgi:metal-dependent hydrolase (beta-lactamase superfamily II)
MLKRRDFLRDAASRSALPRRRRKRELKRLDPDVVIPMHSSAANFIEALRQQMPEKQVLSTVGSCFTFGA